MLTVGAMDHQTDQRQSEADHDESEDLINEVENFPILYDKSLKTYMDTKKKDNVWALIGAKLNLSGEPLLYCKNRKILRPNLASM